jgi:hypothetical protein
LIPQPVNQIQRFYKSDKRAASVSRIAQLKEAIGIEQAREALDAVTARGREYLSG